MHRYGTGKEGNAVEQQNILVCDDEKAIVDALRIYLTQAGYRVLSAGNGREALRILEEEPVHLVILDVMMPQMDGITAIQRIREASRIPVIMLSAKSEGADKILGLDLGADDYVAKPFDPYELLARVKSQLRRYTQLGADLTSSQVYRLGGLTVDDEKKEVRVDGEQVKLTPMEYGILLLLIKNPGRVYTIPQIYEQVWNEPAYAAENTVAVHVRRIRKKIEINPENPKYLKVVWGIGYKLEKQ